MNIKKAINSQLSKTESKENKQNNQPEHEHNHRYGDYLEGYQLEGGRRGKEEMV